MAEILANGEVRCVLSSQGADYICEKWLESETTCANCPIERLFDRQANHFIEKCRKDKLIKEFNLIEFD